MYYTKDQIDRAQETDLVSFLQSQGETLTRSGKEYRWKLHDSMTIYKNKWFRHSQSKGGKPIDFVMEFYGKTFMEAVEMLIGETGAVPAVAADTPEPSPFHLPMRAETNTKMKEYLVKERALFPQIVDHFILIGDLYQAKEQNAVVFVGRDRNGHPRYAHTRSITEKIRKDVYGAEKNYNFGYRGGNNNLFVFEAAIDMLSFICMYPEHWEKQNYICLGGVSGKSLVQFLSDSPKITNVFLCLDSDETGDAACQKLLASIPDKKIVQRLRPSEKDWNEVLVKYREDLSKIPKVQSFTLRDDMYVKTFCLADLEPEEVQFLWNPYIPLGKLTIIQGDPGQGKTFLAMMLTAALTSGASLPNREATEPVSVIYQTAEDGYADTIVPRLLSLKANLKYVHSIDDSDKGLTLDDDRLEKAIIKHNAKLVILDPIQAFLGADVDMNRANVVRPIFRKLGDLASGHQCAIVLIGHLNKASGTSSTYRGLGSIDITAVVRSIMFVGKVKKDPEKKMVIHEKSSLAPPGKSVGFTFEKEDEDDDRVFRWLGLFDYTADDLLSGELKPKRDEEKVSQAKKMIIDLLSDGKKHFNKELVDKGKSMDIAERTISAAKAELKERLGKEREGQSWKFWLKEE